MPTLRSGDRLHKPSSQRRMVASTMLLSHSPSRWDGSFKWGLNAAAAVAIDAKPIIQSRERTLRRMVSVERSDSQNPNAWRRTMGYVCVVRLTSIAYQVNSHTHTHTWRIPCTHHNCHNMCVRGGECVFVWTNSVEWYFRYAITETSQYQFWCWYIRHTTPATS